MVRCIDLTLRSREKSQSCSEQPSTLPALMHIASAVDQNIERAEFLRDFLRQRFDRCGRAHVQLEPLGSLFQVLNFRVVRVGRYQRGAVGSERFGYRTADSFSSSDSVTLRCSCATIGRCSAVISTSQT